MRLAGGCGDMLVALPKQSRPAPVNLLSQFVKRRWKYFNRRLRGPGK